MRIVIEGSGFTRDHVIASPTRQGEVLETLFESEGKLVALVRIADGEEEGELGLAIRGGSTLPAEVEVIDIRACPVPGMTVVPEGRFIFGSDRGSPAERPQREAELPAFACGLREVGNAEYLEFLNFIQQRGDHSLCHPEEGPLKSHIPDGWDDPALRAPDAPVTGVDWFDAYAYAAWKGWRLPTEDEWEKAARGSEGDDYPWGDEPDPALANTAAANAGLASTTAFLPGRSVFGLYNAAGNVWEWTASAGPERDQAFVRGGSYRTDLLMCRSFVRNWIDRLTRRDDLGFRCAADL